MLVTQQLPVATDLHSIFPNCQTPKNIQNILFCIQKKKEIHTGSEQLEGERQNFLGELFLELLLDLT